MLVAPPLNTSVAVVPPILHPEQYTLLLVVYNNDMVYVLDESSKVGKSVIVVVKFAETVEVILNIPPDE